MTEDSNLLTPAELCERWKHVVRQDTLAMWRHQKKGPPYLKVGSKVLYALKDVVEYEANNQKLVSGDNE